MKRVLTAVALIGLLTAGCTSSSGTAHRTGRTAPASSVAASSVAASSVAASPSGTPVAASTLGALLSRGVASLTSAHLAISFSIGSQTVRSSGDETVRSGRLRSIDLSTTLPSGGILRIRIVGGRTYARFPAAVVRTTRPWVLVAASSPSARIRALATTVDAAVTSASVSNATQFVAAARSVRRLGASVVGRVPTTRYALTVDVSALPATSVARQKLAGAGVTKVPVQLWLDAAGRPVQLSESVQALGQITTALATLSRINLPVTITAPPAAQVGTQ